MEKEEICPCCKEHKVCDRKWGEVHATLANYEMKGNKGIFSYDLETSEYHVCKKCYKMLRRNHYIIPFITWLLPVLFIVIVIAFIPGTLKRVLLLFAFAYICTMGNNLNGFYSFYGALFRPIFGRYEVSPYGSMEERREMKKERKQELSKNKKEE